VDEALTGDAGPSRQLDLRETRGVAALAQPVLELFGAHEEVS